MMLTCPKRGCHGAACLRVAQCSDQGQTLTRWSRASQRGFAPQMFLVLFLPHFQLCCPRRLSEGSFPSVFVPGKGGGRRQIHCLWDRLGPKQWECWDCSAWRRGGWREAHKARKYLQGVQRGPAQDQALLSSAQGRDQGQWAQPGAQEVPSDSQELQTRLDAVLGTLLGAALLELGWGWMEPEAPSHLNQTAIL